MLYLKFARLLRRILWQMMAIARAIPPMKYTIVWLMHTYPRLLGRWIDRYEAYRLTMGKISREIQKPLMSSLDPIVPQVTSKSNLQRRYTVHQLVIGDPMTGSSMRYVQDLSDWLHRSSIDGRRFAVNITEERLSAGYRPLTELPMHDECLVILHYRKGCVIPDEIWNLVAPILLVPEEATTSIDEDKGEFNRTGTIADDHLTALAKKCYAGVARSGIEALVLRRAGVPVIFDGRSSFEGISDALCFGGVVRPVNCVALPKAAAGSIEFVGHINGSYSLGRITRALAIGVERLRPNRVRVVPVEGHEYGRIDGVPVRELPDIEKLIRQTSNLPRPIMCITHHYPPITPVQRSDLNLVLFPWEESLVPSEILLQSETAGDAVLAPSSFVKKVLIDSGIRRPVFDVLQAPDLTAFLGLNAGRDWPRDPGRFVFLHVSSCFPRKGVDVLLAAYAEAFDRNEKVELVIKGFPNLHTYVEEQISRLHTTHPNLAPITFINEDTEDAQILELYRNADVLVLPTRGEGFNMPAAEAFAAEIPTVLTAGSGHLDFADGDTAWLIDYRYAYSTSHVKSAGSVWMEPDAAKLADIMRNFFEQSHTAEGRAAIMSRVERARARVNERISSHSWLDGVTRGADKLLARAPLPKRLRVAWVSTWKTKCGIAEYSRFLLEHFNAEDFNIGVFGDQRTPSDGENPAAVRFALKSWHHSVEGWRRHCTNVVQFDPDVIVFQHNWGMFGAGDFAAIVTDSRFSNTVIVIVLHNTWEMDTFTRQEREIAFLAFRRSDRILVHGIDDLNRLKKYGFADRTTLFPHGVKVAANNQTVKPPGPPGKKAAPVIGSFGFVMPHKGLDILIRLLPLIRAQIPGAILRLVNAELDEESSHNELKRCMKIADQIGMSRYVQFIPDFLSTEESLCHLSHCDVIVFPYQATFESASGAVRLAMSAERPVVTSAIPIFEELGDARFVLPDNSLDKMAEKLIELIENSELQSAIVLRQKSWMHERTWRKMANRLAGIIQALVLERNCREVQ